MSVDTNVIYDTPNLPNALESILDAATHNLPNPISIVTDRFLERWRIKKWTIDENQELRGPGGFAFRQNGPLVEGYHLLPYDHFTFQGDDGQILHSAFVYIAQAIGSTRMIFFHELLPHDGSTFDEIESSLIQNIGPAAESWEQAHNAKHYSPKCWIKTTVMRSKTM